MTDFYQHPLNYESPHLSPCSRTQTHTQPLIWRVTHHYAKWSIASTLIKPSAAKARAPQRQSQKKHLCASNGSALNPRFPGLYARRSETCGGERVQRPQNEKSVWLPSCLCEEWRASQRRCRTRQEFQLITPTFFKRKQKDTWNGINILKLLSRDVYAFLLFQNAFWDLES